MNTQEFYQRYLSDPAYRLEIQQKHPEEAKILDDLVAQQPQMAQQAPMQQPQQQGQSVGLGGIVSKLGPKLFGGGSSAAAPEAVGSAVGKFGLPGKLMSDGSVATNWGSMFGGGAGGLGGSLGLAGTAGLGAMAGLMGAGAYNYGGRKILGGDAQAGDYLDTALQINPVTMMLNPALDVLGLGSVGDILGLSGPRMKERNTKKAQSLLDKGTQMHFNDTSTMFDTANKRGKLDDRVAADFVGMNDGEWINNKFASSRDVADLRPEDVWGSLDVYDTLGNDYLGTTTEQQRRDLMQRSLDENLWYEGNGRTRIKDENRDRFKQLFEEVRSGAPAPQQGRPQAYTPDRTNPFGSPLPQEGMRTMDYQVGRDGPRPAGLPDMGQVQPFIKHNVNPVSDRYGADVAKQVQAAQASGRNVGTGGAGMVWDGSNFVRR